MSSSAAGEQQTTEAAVNVAENLESVRGRMKDCVERCSRAGDSVQLVAVSKTKPVSLLMEAYEAGQRVFGENYAQELMEKAGEMPDDVRWHFIGPLQSNKAAPLVKSVGLPKLECVETVSSMKVASKLSNAVESILEGEDKSAKLRIFLQVNTSGEDSKSGVAPGDELSTLAKEISESCPFVEISGLMTIGAPGDMECFKTLVQCRDDLCKEMGMSPDQLELSMGMSGDFEQAIEHGATSIRVGSTIFGARDYSAKK